MTDTESPTKSGFSAAERAAMKQRAKELKLQQSREESTQAVLDRIAELAEADRVLAERIHAIVTKAAPQLTPRTWYGFPAYANAEGKIVVFFKDAAKFKDRYATLGFETSAQLDDGEVWPVAFAITALSPAEEKKIAELVAKAAG